MKGRPGSLTRRNPLHSRGAAVFENSTACAPRVGARIRAGIEFEVCVQVRPATDPLGVQWQPEFKQYSSTPSTHPGLLHVYEQPLV